MGWLFVKRRMATELGSDWQSRFGNFEKQAAAAASLGQVHRAEDAAAHSLPANFNILICARRSKLT